MVNQLKKMTSMSEQQQVQTLFIFEPPLMIEKSNHILPKNTKIDEALLLDSHQAQYQKSINIPHWREVLWAINTDIDRLDITQYSPTYSTSYEAQAIRQGLATSIKPLGIAGLVKTCDQFFVFGLRTGVAKGGYLCNAPAGHCSPQQSGDNLLMAGFMEELETELGVAADEISQVSILGYQTDPDFGRGVNVVIATDLTITFAEIRARHQQGQIAFKAAIDSGLSYNAALSQLSQDGLLNIDSHEHDALIAIPAHTEVLQDIVQSREFTDTDQQSLEIARRYPVLDIAKGSLMMLLNATST